MTAVRPRSLGTDSESSQSLLQHAYFIAAVVIVFAVVILRFLFLRKRNRALTEFFRIGGSPYPYGPRHPDDPNYGSYNGVQLAPLPSAYLPDRRVQAADVDAYGRRLGPAGEGWDGKDALPAYNNFDRPPKYVEAGWPHGGQTPQPTAFAAMTPLPEGEHSGVAHSDTTDRVPGDSVDHDVHPDAALPPPVHHDVSGS